MPRFDNPIVLVTRPAASAAEFVAVLRDVAGPFEAVLSPAFENEPVFHDLPPFDGAVFTSKAAIEHAPNGAGRMAWCVGDATAKAARAKGYDAETAGGDVGTLTALILDRRPRGRLLHIRGEKTYGDITSRLTEGGLTCTQAIVYRKAQRSATPEAVSALRSGRDVLVPVFSAETVSILADWKIDFSNGHVVAMSPAVAKAAGRLNPASVDVSDVPDMAHMAAASARMIA